MIDLKPAAEAVIDLLPNIGTAQFDHSTPCADYTVADLLLHLDEVARGSTALARKAAVPATAEPSDMLSDNNWRTTLADRLWELAAAWADSTAWQGTTDAGIELPNETWGRIALTELVVHGWDLARAVDCPFALPEPILQACLDHVVDFVPNAPIPALWGSAVAVPEDAALLDRIVAVTGRVPGPVRGGAGHASPSGDARSDVASVSVNGVALGIESFGSEDDPLVLLVGGTTMLSWPDSLCERLASGGRRVVRYDLRDSGASTTLDPENPAYDLRDLVADAVALVEVLGGGSAHLAGIGVGGMVAQVAAVEHPDVFSALTLIGTRPVAPGPVDADLPDHDHAVMGPLFSRAQPDWTDRDAVVAFATEGARLMGDDPREAGAAAARIWDRTPSRDPAVHQANQLAMVFSRIDCAPRWRERLSELGLPTLVVHGAADPFFPVGNGRALAADIPGARLLVLDDMGTAVRDAAADEIAAAMLAL